MAIMIISRSYDQGNKKHDQDHENHKHNHDHDHHKHDHNHDHSKHDYSEEHKHEHDCHDHHHHEHADHDRADHESCQEATEENITNTTLQQTPITHKKPVQPTTGHTTTPRIATEEAVEKLQQRFTQLMTQCADLTEEKQRLEHLVMQLQSETETIGEYIALYQTQRRILKQREYEKAAQTAMLQAEREQMRERLTMLNNLVNSLGMELPQKQHLKQQINEALTQQNAININTTYSPNIENNTIDSSESSSPLNQTTTAATTAKDLNSPESQQILHKIQDIITEIKENTKELPTISHSVDHLNCCSGKFEVV
ncbi:cyclic AMP-responsive element-binding protein 5-like [Lucilia sericata]|uniref:cyclic AMP-responsive element-binding protein 5-like n=1 Tax=Lucilia sericata TaxID=13632 RepID=UPI0018A8821B|nr:cyclic AMP-responsive element-binding protein 5-like [Lucilia sericata]